MSLPKHPKGYVCVKARQKLTLDGNLEDAAWKDAPWTDDFVDIEGGAKPRPRHRTRVKMLWDDEYFYIGADIQEPHVWATLTQHDSVIFQDDDFEVFIDPDGDNHQYYEYEINAFGTDWDLRLVKPYRDGGPALNEWEIPGLKKAVKVNGTINDPFDNDAGWTVELAIPWKVLAEFAKCASPPQPGDQWRVNFSRVDWDMGILNGKYVKIPDRPEYNWVWSPQGVIDMHRPEMWGYVQFEETAKPFVADPLWEDRCRLMAFYHAQAKFKDEKGKYARNLSELQVKEQGVSMETTPEGYIARIRTKDGFITVRQDSLITHEK